MGKPQIQQDPKHRNAGVLKVTEDQQYHFIFPWKLQETILP